jgi:hypothetical protein
LKSAVLGFDGALSNWIDRGGGFARRTAVAVEGGRGRTEAYAPKYHTSKNGSFLNGVGGPLLKNSKMGAPPVIGIFSPGAVVAEPERDR